MTPEASQQGPGDGSQGPVPRVEELLKAAARGHVGIDRRFLASIVEQNDTASILRFARQPHDQDKLDLEPLLVDLFRHYNAQEQTQEALEFFIDAIRRAPEDVDDSLIQALLPFGNQAAEPLLRLYEELGEEQGSDIAFLLAALRVRDPRVLQVLLGRLEYDAADGAFCLGLYGDAAERGPLETMLAELPAEDVELRREFKYALELLEAPEPKYQPEPFDIYAEYPERELPPFDVLDESERLAMLAAPEADVRAGAAYSFFNLPLSPKPRAALSALAQSDPEPAVRGQAWASLGDVVAEETRESAALRDAMIGVLNDVSRPAAERGGAAVGLYAVANRDDVRVGVEALYAMGGTARIKALETMWRSLWQPYAKYFAAHLEETDPAILRHALRGAGYFRLTPHIDKIEKFFEREPPYDDLREDALFAYALAMPGETRRGTVKGMLRKIDQLASLTADEVDLVELALDERLRLHGLAPVFEAERMAEHAHVHEPEPVPETRAAPAPAAPADKIGRNDPCPCGSGKKYKKCHGTVH